MHVEEEMMRCVAELLTSAPAASGCLREGVGKRGRVGGEVGGTPQGIYAGWASVGADPTVSAAQGSLYLRTNGSSTSTRLYVNTDGTTGWTNFTSAT